MSSAAEESSRSELHPAVRIGHVHLRVADLERATSSYRDVLGFEVTADGSDFGLPGAAFLAAGDYHHHIGLNTWHSQGGTPPPEGHTGLHHFAIVYPDRRELARAVERLLERGYPTGGAEDHGATISVYLSDPDGNGIELYYDRPREEWGSPRPNRSILGSYWWNRAPLLSPYSAECVEGRFSELRVTEFSEVTPVKRDLSLPHLKHLVRIAQDDDQCVSGQLLTSRIV